MNQLTTAGVFSFAEALGEALGRGVSRGINAGLTGIVPPSARNVVAVAPARRGRPPKPASAVATCSEKGCGNPARSKGLCSKHYQAMRRRTLK